MYECDILSFDATAVRKPTYIGAASESLCNKIYWVLSTLFFNGYNMAPVQGTPPICHFPWLWGPSVYDFGPQLHRLPQDFGQRNRVFKDTSSVSRLGTMKKCRFRRGQFQLVRGSSDGIGEASFPLISLSLRHLAETLDQTKFLVP